jgi:hypothetical protein
MATTTATVSSNEAVERHIHKPVSDIETLGHLRLRDAQTNEIILVPTPSADPNDPLNW